MNAPLRGRISVASTVMQCHDRGAGVGQTYMYMYVLSGFYNSRFFTEIYQESRYPFFPLTTQEDQSFTLGPSSKLKQQRSNNKNNNNNNNNNNKRSTQSIELHVYTTVQYKYMYE